MSRKPNKSNKFKDHVARDHSGVIKKKAQRNQKKEKEQAIVTQLIKFSEKPDEDGLVQQFTGSFTVHGPALVTLPLGTACIGRGDTTTFKAQGRQQRILLNAKKDSEGQVILRVMNNPLLCADTLGPHSSMAINFGGLTSVMSGTSL